MIETHGLGKTYGDFAAVADLDLVVEPGEVFAFLGPNGAGKTTTIRMLMGTLVPTTGRATIAGLDCHKERAELMKQVGYLPDVPSFYDFLRGRELLAFVGEMHGMTPAQARESAHELLASFAMADASEDYAVNYSMGMKKKLALACALIHRPKVLILDEPTSGLDPRASKDVQERLLANAGQGRTIFLSTHLLDMAERLCTRVGIIQKGRLVAIGTLEELRAQQGPGRSLEEMFLTATDTDMDTDTEPAPP